MDSSRFLQLAPPPRPVPLPLVCRALLGTAGRTGSLFLGFGMLFLLVFGLDVRPADELRLALSSATTRGTVTEARQTTVSVNEVTVWRYDFTFRAQDGRDYVGRSYSTGRLHDRGDQVLIEYAAAEPAAARISDSRLSPAPYWALVLTSAFPLAGAGLVVAAAIRGIRQIALLRHGALTKGRILYSRPTNLTVDGVNFAKYEYEFLASDGIVYYDSARAPASDLIGDEPQEPILYDTANPGRSMLVDSLPLGYQLDVDAYGHWATHQRRRSIAWCAFAAAGLAGLVALILVNLLSLL